MTEPCTKLMRQFSNFVAIDWSGQNVARPKGLAVAHAGSGSAAPVLLAPDGGWSRQAILDWLLNHAEAQTDMIIGLDLSPSLPFIDKGGYFPSAHTTPANAKSLWALVDELSAHDDHLSVNGFLSDPEFRRHFRHQNACGDLFGSGAGRMRRCEIGQREMGLSPYSCFNLVGAAQVGKSSLTGMRVLHRLNGAIPVWPFDPVPDRGPLIVEIYTSIAARTAGIRKGLSKILDGATLDASLSNLGSRPHSPLQKYTDHATDAILTSAWLRQAANNPTNWSPASLSSQIAATEGWTFGIV